MQPPASFARQWDRLPEAVRSVITEESAAVSREMRNVRRPRDLRRMLRDPAALNRVSEPVAPALDRIASLVARSALPVSGRHATAAVAATGMAGATVSSALEVCGLLGIEVPPVAAAAAGAAGAVAIGAELVEFYLIASVVSAELRRAGRDDPALLRRVLMETYLGEDPSPAGLARGGFSRVARALVRRSLPRMAPVAGIPAAGWSSWRDLRRARAAVGRVLAERPA